MGTDISCTGEQLLADAGVGDHDIEAADAVPCLEGLDGGSWIGVRVCVDFRYYQSRSFALRKRL
ncbi:uncharacterized protein N7479_001802 [Penicillium vulpinum]|uniref:uncharacterized protein n=1 Tax=Penicillium vulpinum TaxID=29845 RepID=UPI0025473DF6|nr:uncharacterized protein N7479_001802 [Penicillium vulpinum]KAJ5971884.1 hypothetical protein N7479_001802 [Penicillium vulpinum]